jgi:ubiquinone/menaquinone biosynthesis C-methylase UbiE
MTMTDAANFDDLAETYDEYRVGYSKTLYDTLEELGFRAGWHILDVGCGTGIASAPLVQRGMRMTGVDPSEPMLARARVRIPQGEFVLGKAEQLPFEDKTFGGAILAQAIHWMDREKALEEMSRVVKPGGRVAVWWKNLVTDEPIRAVRNAAANAAGVEPPSDLMKGSFLEFYRHPFKERTLRVLPFTITTNAERWMGYERTRRRALNSMGDGLSRYLQELQKILDDKSEGKPFQVKYTQYLYVGEVD